MSGCDVSGAPRRRRLAGRLLVLSAALAIPLLASASPLSLYQQRQVYRQALDHLTAGRAAEFEQARAVLDDYVLAPYLDYYRVQSQLASVSDRQMHEFQARHRELPATGILHHRWLKYLGSRAQWQRLLDNYRTSFDPELRCYRARALLASNRRDEALADVAELWVVGHSQPKACDPLFDLWIGAGMLTQERAWTRLQLAVGVGERRLARYLLRFFEQPLEPWARALYEVHVDPERISRTGAFAEDNPYARVVIAHGITRLASRDAGAAARAWQRYQDTHAFSATDSQALTETVLLAQAREGTFPPHRLTGLSAAFFERIADAAVKAERWHDVLHYVDQLPPGTQQDLRWRYWSARALSSTGLGTEQAQLTYEALARERHYYGFLAASHLGSAVRLNGIPHEIDRETLEAVQRIPAVDRALELYAVGDLINARREWIALLAELDPKRQLHAALLAQEVGWLAQSIITANLADLRDNLDLRFPLAYVDVFREISQATAVPRPFLLAVARQESAFDPRARSSANARGLMQLMHPTANLVAKRVGVAAPSVADLYDPVVSVSLGAHHLARLLERYDHRRPVAAAYNAGEHRVDRWIGEHAGKAMDVWIETIPFRETRDYVKNVLAFSQVYGQILGDHRPMLDKNEAVLN